MRLYNAQHSWARHSTITKGLDAIGTIYSRYCTQCMGLFYQAMNCISLVYCNGLMQLRARWRREIWTLPTRPPADPLLDVPNSRTFLIPRQVRSGHEVWAPLSFTPHLTRTNALAQPNALYRWGGCRLFQARPLNTAVTCFVFQTLKSREKSHH